jgi:hypothetical protein
VWVCGVIIACLCVVEFTLVLCVMLLCLSFLVLSVL